MQARRRRKVWRWREFLVGEAGVSVWVVFNQLYGINDGGRVPASTGAVSLEVILIRASVIGDSDLAPEGLPTCASAISSVGLSGEGKGVQPKMVPNL